MSVNFSKFNNSWYDPRRNIINCAIWFMVNAIFFQNSINPSSKIKIFFLRLFGAKIGNGVVIKPSVNIKYPWNLEIDDNTSSEFGYPPH